MKYLPYFGIGILLGIMVLFFYMELKYSNQKGSRNREEHQVYQALIEATDRWANQRPRPASYRVGDLLIETEPMAPPFDPEDYTPGTESYDIVTKGESLCLLARRASDHYLLTTAPLLIYDNHGQVEYRGLNTLKETLVRTLGPDAAKRLVHVQ